MKRNKKKIWITALSVAAVTGITMGIVLPLTMKSEPTPVNSVRASGIAEKYDLTTSDLEKVVLPRVEVTNITSAGYDYKIKNWDEPFVENVSLITIDLEGGVGGVEVKLMVGGVVDSTKFSGRVTFPQNANNINLWQVQLGGWETDNNGNGTSFLYDYLVIDTSPNKEWKDWTWNVSKEIVVSDTKVMYLPEGIKWKTMDISLKLETKTYNIGDKKTRSNVSYYETTSPFSSGEVNVTRTSETELNINLSQPYIDKISMEGADFKVGATFIYEKWDDGHLGNTSVLSSYDSSGIGNIDPVQDNTFNVRGLDTSLFLVEDNFARYDSIKTFEKKIGYYDLNNIA